MYRILLATDGSKSMKRLVGEVLTIAVAVKAEVTILNVIEHNDYSYMARTPYTVEVKNDVDKQLKAEADRIVDEAASPFRDKGLKVKTKIVDGVRSPADVICDIASKDGYNLIAIGSRGLRGVKELFLGSVSNKVAHLGCTNVLIVR
ncbi:MAG: universal stress protein [Bacillota bacterium]|nr:universal stress protein [Bacillota bacterium]MDW7729328.1 universal stress protein [Bacillota bacterium]